MLRIGVLGLQGDVEEHMEMLRRLSATPVWVKDLQSFKGVQALVIPGGESTTIGKLMEETGLLEEVRKKARGGKGMPVFGTCAGAILLAKSAGKQQKQTGQKLLELVDMQVDRNAFGRQRESFEAEVEIQLEGNKKKKLKMNVPFIRAPVIEKVSGNCRAIATFENRIVAAQEGNLLAACFHPELTEDTRLHEYFLEKVRRQRTPATATPLL